MDHFLLLLLLDFLFLFPFPPVLSHGSGAPFNRCESMQPGHWVNPQESLPPFQILIDKTVISPGDRVNLTLTTLQGQAGFKGFLVMVKDAGEEWATGDNKKNYGMFDLASSDLKSAQAVHCFDARNSAMTHVINDVKNSVQLFWIAPDVEESQPGSSRKERELKVVATFVKDFWTIWTNVEPSNDARLLLQPKQQFSSHPKFPQSKPDEKKEFVLRGDQVFGPPEGASGDIQIDGSSSWDHFTRAWNYVLNMFGSST